jgi:hypothetical protein
VNCHAAGDHRHATELSLGGLAFGQNLSYLDDHGRLGVVLDPTFT